MDVEGNILEKIIVCGGNRLSGIVKVEGVKNVVLFIIIVILLVSEGKIILNDVLVFFDVFMIGEVLRYLNVEVDFEINCVVVDVLRELKIDVFFEYVRKMCVLVFVMGFLLVCIGEVCVVLFGGCVIGLRLID